MAHVRRAFVDVLFWQGSAIAKQAILWIAGLYAIKKQIRSKTPQ